MYKYGVQGREETFWLNYSVFPRKTQQKTKRNQKIGNMKKRFLSKLAISTKIRGEQTKQISNY